VVRATDRWYRLRLHAAAARAYIGSMRNLSALAVAALLAGCADRGPSYFDQLNMLVGRPEVEAVQALGAPDRVFDSDGARFLGWTSIRTRVIPGAYWPGGFGGFHGRRGGFGGGYWEPDRYVQAQCLTTATIRDGRVQGFSLNGDCPR
jgi:hypothetical protein